MANDPLSEMIFLVGRTRDLDMVQAWINDAREAAPTDLTIQTELDNQQASLTRKRNLLEMVMLEIRSKN